MCGSQAFSEPAVEKSSLILLGDLSYLFFWFWGLIQYLYCFLFSSLYTQPTLQTVLRGKTRIYSFITWDRTVGFWNRRNEESECQGGIEMITVT